MYAAIRVFCLAMFLVIGSASAHAADTFTVDPVHSSISFMIPHAGISTIHGRFNDFSGTFVIDSAEPTKSSFSLAIKIESVDTNNKKRDDHLQADDYFDVKKFPAITFQSTKVRAVDGGYEVTGDLTIHGVTNPITMQLKGGQKTVEFPKGTSRVGVVTSVVVKRSEFGMKTALGSLGDEVQIEIGLQAVKQ
jgi:polyisoprenoid-binding protein YceI